MKVVPRSVRPRSRRITTELRPASVRGWLRCFEHRRGGEEQAPIRLQRDHLVGGELGRRVGLDEVPVRVEQPAFDGDLVRLPHHVQDHRQAQRDEHRVLQRDEAW